MGSLRLWGFFSVTQHNAHLPFRYQQYCYIQRYKLLPLSVQYLEQEELDWIVIIQSLK